MCYRGHLILYVKRIRLDRFSKKVHINMYASHTGLYSSQEKDDF